MIRILHSPSPEPNKNAQKDSWTLTPGTVYFLHSKGLDQTWPKSSLGGGRNLWSDLKQPPTSSFASKCLIHGSHWCVLMQMTCHLMVAAFTIQSCYSPPMETVTKKKMQKGAASIEWTQFLLLLLILFFLFPITC